MPSVNAHAGFRVRVAPWMVGAWGGVFGKVKAFPDAKAINTSAT